MKIFSFFLLFGFLLVSICSGQNSKATDQERREMFSVNEKALLLEKDGKIAEAEDELRRLAEKYPAYEGTWYVLGLSLFKQRKSDEAVAAFQKSLSIESEQNGSNLYLGFTLMHQKKDYEAAIPYLKKATEFHIKDFKRRNLPTVAFNQHLAEALFMAKRFEKASVEYAQLVAVQPEHFYYLSRLVSCYMELNRLPEAENLLKSKIDAGAENSSVWKLYGDVLAKQGKIAESEKAYAKAKTF